MGRKRLFMAGLVLVVFVVLVMMGVIWHKVAGQEKQTRAILELHAISAACGGYEREFGIFPSGTPEQILEALLGSNPKGIVFLVPSSGRTDPKRDPWGSAYRTVPAGPPKPRFYSVGPDRVDDTLAPGSDDLPAPP